MSLQKIRIIGNASCQFTTQKAAQKYVKAGRAQWTDDGTAIRFVGSHHAHLTVMLAEQNRILERARQNVSIDKETHHGRVATFKELRAIPMVGDVRRMYL